MMGMKFQFICLLFAVLVLSKVKCMNMREEENEIDDDDRDDDRKIKSDKEISPTPTPMETTSDATENSPDSTMMNDESSSDESQPTTPAPKRDTFLRFIDDLFQVPLKMLKMFSNILSRSLEAFTSKPTSHGDN